MKICTLAFGDDFLEKAQTLADSLPLSINICKSLPDCANLFYKNKAGFKIFNTNCKRFAIKENYHEQGTLCIDSDCVCESNEEFIDCCNKLKELGPGIYSPYVFSAYGFRHPKVTDKIIDREKLTYNLKFFDPIIRLSDNQLLNFYMPWEWFYFFKFKDENQKNVFFDMWDYLDEYAINNNNYHLRAECNLIGISALNCGLEVKQIKMKFGVNHKK